MGKRSDFPRLVGDSYQTHDPKAVARLKPFLSGVETYAEPCCGEGALMRQLDTFLTCVYANDIEFGHDALAVENFNKPDCFITNPPWTRAILHPLIRHLSSFAPCWLLFDSDWSHTRQAAPFLPHCVAIVSVGRLKWIPDSPYTGKDNVSWHLFDSHHVCGPHFYGQPIIEVAA